MRKLFLSPNGPEVDLDDPETYRGYPQDIKSLENRMFFQIGYAHVYMNHWNKDVYEDWKGAKDQKHRVEALIKNFSENRSKNYQNVRWYQEQILIFENEIENMC